MLLGWWRRRRRAKARARPFPAAWRAIIDQGVPYARRLSPEDRAELEGHVLVFLDEKRFEGCGGLELTDEVRVTIAAQACVLLLHSPDPDYFPDATSILVYPSAYRAPGSRRAHPDGSVSDEPDVRLGEAWRGGEVVLSWDDVRRGAADIRDGQNVVLHEFAHKLDQQDGVADGAPILPARSRYVAWARVLGGEYRALQERLEHHRRTVLGPYAATSPAEFFAVATECFFEKGAALRKKHPELYEQLSRYYRQDPASLPPPRHLL